MTATAAQAGRGRGVLKHKTSASLLFRIACPCTCTCAACAACASTRAAFLVPPNSWQPRDTTSARTCTCTPDMIQTIQEQAYLFVRQRARQELVGCNSSRNPVQWRFMWEAMPPYYQRHPIQAGKKSGPVFFQWARFDWGIWPCTT